MSSIFISHTATDKDIVDAFSVAVQKLLGDRVELSYSTSTEHGPRHGDQWLPWIHQQVRDSVFTIVLITPSSVHKLWILWEAGAVAGTSIASGQNDSRKVRPVIFRLTPEQVPDPFKDTQVVRGDEREAMYGMFEGWITDILSERQVLARAVRLLPNVLQEYLAAVNAALDQLKSRRNRPKSLGATSAKGALGTPMAGAEVRHRAIGVQEPL